MNLAPVFNRSKDLDDTDTGNWEMRNKNSRGKNFVYVIMKNFTWRESQQEIQETGGEYIKKYDEKNEESE